MAEKSDAVNDDVQANFEPPAGMDPRIRDIQPGGGIVFGLEKAWGAWRRWWLKRFRKAYVARMRASRLGDAAGVPHEVLDPRDLKLYRNQTTCSWRSEDDPFAWRDRLPFARVGLAELVVFSILFWSGMAILVAAACFFVTPPLVRIGLAGCAAGFALLGAGVAWFFRDPPRTIPTGPGEVVAPADGIVVGVEQVDHPFVGGSAIEISIFLSVFNVHINRAPAAAHVVGVQYEPGKFLNALRAESERENEQLAIQLVQESPPFRRMIVRQITGAIARRIVCWLKPGDRLQRGEQLGMIKLGSRTVLVIPNDDGLDVTVRIGDKVKAGSSILGRYAT